MNKADIIIVNYKSTDLMIQCLKSVFNTQDSRISNVFVYDNGSEIDQKLTANLFPKVNYIRNDTNIGFSAAVNKGLKISDSPYIVLLNPDTFITNGIIEKTVSYMEKHKDIGIIGPKVLNADGSVQGSARAFPTPLTTLFGRNSPLTKLFPNNAITRKNILTSQCDGVNPLPVEWVSGACMVIRKEAIDAIKGFDERFFLYWEDTDLCKRIRDKGWQVLYFPAAEIIHIVGQSSSQSPLFATYHFHRSCYYLFLKHARMPMKLMAPIAFFGLSMRALLIMAIHLIQRRFSIGAYKENPLSAIHRRRYPWPWAHTSRRTPDRPSGDRPGKSRTVPATGPIRVRPSDSKIGVRR